MKLEKARREGNSLILETRDPAAWRWLIQFKPGDYEISRKGKKRSLDSNSYLWSLIGKIAALVQMSSDEVYRQAVHEAGVYTPMYILSDAVEDFTKSWKSNGTGWLVDVVDDSPIPGMKLIKAYKGSSKYDVHQMSRLIDYVVEDAKALGIETLTERELSLLKEGWK